MKVFYYGNSTKAGIYKIVNTVDGKFYIGSTYSFYKRGPQHQSALRANNHHCRHLQAAWNKYGENAFEFHVVEVTDVQKRTEIEQNYLNEHFGKPHCYNSLPKSEKHARDTRPKHILKQIYGRKKSKEEREKISNSRKGIRILKDREFNNEVQEILQCIIDNKTLPTILQTPEISSKQLRLAYNKWTKGSRNIELREKHKQEKLRLKQWLVEQNLWYDARSDSWIRKSPEDQKKALKILKENAHPPFG